MAQLCLVPLTGRQSENVDHQVDRDLPAIDETAAMTKPFGLWAAPDGRLRAAPLDQPENGPISEGDSPIFAGREWGQSPSGFSAGEWSLVAALKCLDEDANPVWYAAFRSKRLGINGTTPPLPVARLEPGTLLSVDRHFWWTARLWRPQAQTVPPELAESPCPVCGAKLSLAPVVQCPNAGCGRWTHLERPEEPEASDALNCYLIAGECCGCKQPATLEAIVMPQPSEKLLPVDPDDGPL